MNNKTMVVKHSQNSGDSELIAPKYTSGSIFYEPREEVEPDEDFYDCYDRYWNKVAEITLAYSSMKGIRQFKDLVGALGLELDAGRFTEGFETVRLHKVARFRNVNIYTDMWIHTHEKDKWFSIKYEKSIWRYRK